MFRLYLNRHDLAAPVVPFVAQHNVAPTGCPQPGPEDGDPVAEVVPVVAPQVVAPQDAAQPPTPTGRPEEIGSVRNNEQAPAEQVSSVGGPTKQAPAAEPAPNFFANVVFSGVVHPKAILHGS